MSPLYKHSVKALVVDVSAMADWAGGRFMMWMQERMLQDLLRQVQVVELSFAPGRVLHALKYEVVARSTHTSHQLTQPLRVFHGTYPECLARIIHTRQLHPSDYTVGLGMETHVNFPAVYTAETMDHAMRYSWPSTFLLDNLYHGVMLELEGDSARVLKRKRGEVLFPPDALTIRSIYLFFNMNIAQGQSKNAEWRPELELLPLNLQSRVGTWLTPSALRRSAWHDSD